MINHEDDTHRGRQEYQKIKPFLLLNYLKEHSDKDKIVNSDDIVFFLNNEYGISAERHSITRDIYNLNLYILICEEGYTLEEAIELAEDKENAPIVTAPKRGYYYNYTKYDISNLKILADCIYASPFLSLGKADELSKIVYSLLPNRSAQAMIKSNVLAGRVRTTNISVLNNLNTINYAMATEDYNGEEKVPEKISFKSVHYKLNDVKKQVEKNADKRTVVSPWGLFINNGNYYMLGYNDSNHNVYTYRVDRMKDVRSTGEEREGAEAIEKRGGVQAYAERRFSLQNASSTKVQIEFADYCIDMVVDKLGTKDVWYYQSDNDGKFIVSISTVELTNDFFAWVMSFGKSAKILTESVAQKFNKLLDDVRANY